MSIAPPPPPPGAEAAVGESRGLWDRFAKPVGRWLTAPLRWSVAGKFAGGVLLVLLTMTTIVAVIVWRSDQYVSLYHALTTGQLLTLTALLVAIPLVTYQGVKIWTEGDQLVASDLETAWASGLEAIQNAGLSLDSVPLFLILGSPNEIHERSLMEASQRSMRVTGVPYGSTSLHWYVSSDAVYVFLSDVGLLSALSKTSEGPASSAGPASDVPDRQTLDAASLENFVGENLTESDAQQSFVSESSPSSTLSSRAELGLDYGDEGDSFLPEEVQRERTASLSAEETLNQKQRLRAFAQLVCQSRQPFCPINGVIALFQFESLSASAGWTEELEHGLRTDLEILEESLGLRFPVTALIIGLEREPGFSELVRRVGTDLAAVRRFGHRFPLAAEVSDESLEALSSQVCGAFEDWIYSLFRSDEGLSRPGNPRLFNLLCTVRAKLKSRLTGLLINGFGDSVVSSTESKPLLSGCYLGATGTSASEQAFVRAVFDKLDEEQEMVEWTESMRYREGRRQFWMRAGWVTAGFAAILLLSMIVADRTGLFA